MFLQEKVQHADKYDVEIDASVLFLQSALKVIAAPVVAYKAFLKPHVIHLT